jgi:hypothetical protein
MVAKIIDFASYFLRTSSAALSFPALKGEACRALWSGSGASHESREVWIKPSKTWCEFDLMVFYYSSEKVQKNTA